MKTKLSLFATLLLMAQLTLIHSLPAPQEECHCLKTIPDPSKHLFNSSQLYVFGGGNDETNVMDTASRLNSITGKWETINGMLSAEEFFCGAVVDKKIYLFGGYGPDQKNSRFITNASEVYDCLTDTYTILRPMPETRSDCAAAALNDSIYVAGGTLNPTRPVTSSLIRYDIQTDQWSTLRSMNVPRKHSKLVELNGLLYAIGGDGTTSVEVYDSTTDRWSNVASSTYSHSLFGATVHGGKIYVISNNGFEFYSPNNNQWTTLNAPNDHYEGTSLVTMNDKLWAVGGRYNNGTDWILTKRVYSYDLSTNRWTKQHDMDVPRSFHTSFVVNH